MKKDGEKVAVVKCSSYNQEKVDKAISKSLELIGFDFSKYNGKKVLIKPNLVGIFKKETQEAITTHVSLIEAVCKILKKNHCKIYIGESSFMDTGNTFKKTGIERVAKKYCANKQPIIFEQEKLVYINDSSAKVVKRFPVAEIVKKADLIIDMPKMKTHSLADVTLGIKNLYGLIPGGLKQRLHNKARGSHFSEILIDIYQNFKPGLTIMDGIVGMEGHGPTSGIPKKAGLILASENTIALDIAAASIMDFRPKDIPAIRLAIKRGIYPNYDFELVGMSEIPVIHFKKAFSKTLIARAHALFREKPIICDTNKCVKCGTCARKCPAKAIRLDPFPIIDKRKCIRCFCCMEICPVHALSLSK
jgi:uncharacterized protein (DUF362 family)